MFRNLNPVRNYISNGVNKQSLLCLIIIVIASFLAIGLIWYFSQIPEISEIKEQKPKPVEKTMEEIIKELTVPQEKSEPLEEKTIQELTASKEEEKQVPLSEEIIKNLIVPK